METKLNLYRKMYNVMEKSEAIARDMEIGYRENKYTAVSEAAVLNPMKALFKEEKLIIFPVKATITEHINEFPTKNGMSTRMMSQVQATYKIVDIESGEWELLETVGNGADTQDKGSGKAWTYAFKALFQKTFMLFSGEDTDTTHSDKMLEENTRKNTQSKPPAKKAEPAKKADPVKQSEPRDYHSNIVDLFAKINKPAYEKRVLDHMGVKTVFELTMEDAKLVQDQLSKLVDTGA